jgi:hypothetical protein
VNLRLKAPLPSELFLFSFFLSFLTLYATRVFASQGDALLYLRLKAPLSSDLAADETPLTPAPLEGFNIRVFRSASIRYPAASISISVFFVFC